MSNHITKTVELRAPVSRFWRALTDPVEFGRWFRVELDGPFRVGGTVTGRMTHPGVEGLLWRAAVERLDPERVLAFRWRDVAAPTEALDAEPTTRVEFRLEPTPDGARLTITETGFDAIADPRRLEALRENTQGWDAQSRNLSAYVDAA